MNPCRSTVVILGRLPTDSEKKRERGALASTQVLIKWWSLSRLSRRVPPVWGGCPCGISRLPPTTVPRTSLFYGTLFRDDALTLAETSSVDQAGILVGMRYKFYQWNRTWPTQRKNTNEFNSLDTATAYWIYECRIILMQQCQPGNVVPKSTIYSPSFSSNLVYLFDAI